MSITLRPYQEQALNEIMAALVAKPEVLLQASTGAGKCLAPGTLVLLYDGSCKVVEDISVGDLLMGPDSRPRKVMSLASGLEKMYKVIPIKGEPYTVNESHILSLRITGNGRGVVAPNGKKYLAGEVCDLSVSEYLRSSNTFKHMAKGFRADAINFSSSKKPSPIPPYILGSWLGDGNSRVTELCSVDYEVIEEWHKYAASIGHQCRLVNQSCDKVPVYRVVAPDTAKKGRSSHGNLFLNAMRDLDIIQNKHIPIQYKTASQIDRLELLAGIIDTDGYLSNQVYDLCLKQEQLANDVVFIARSLGLAAYLRQVEKVCTNTGSVGNYWRICISGNIDIIPCKVARRKAKPRKQNKNVLNFGFSLKDMGLGQYYGFELEGPDRHFLLGDFTVTHNTIIFSEIIKRWMTQYPKMNIMVLAHRQELVAQAADKVGQVWPEGRQYVSIACASLGQTNINRRIIIGSVQTLSTDKRLAKLTQNVHLLIIDEIHRLPHVEAGGQYYKLITKLREYNPKLRILGVTATPYRLGHGYIYGPGCRKGRTNLFPDLDHKIGLDDLTQEGYLAPRIELEKSMGADIKSVKLSSGEYNSVELGNLMTRSVYIYSAVETYKKYGEGRDKVLVFAVSIDHAKLLADEFNRAGYEAAAIHSKLNRQTRKGILNSFDHGTLRVLINVEVLTEGWDSPRVNAIMLCRPTTSPGLFVQMIGRGTRLSPGKDTLLVLDLVDNYKTHGSPSDPLVVVPVQREGKADKNIKANKECPACGNVVDATSIECPECGWTWDPSELTDVAEDIKMVQVKRKVKDGKSEVLAWDAHGEVSQKGNFMFTISAKCKPGGLIKTWVDIEGVASDYGMAKANNLWLRLAGTRPPASVREAEMRSGELKMPGRVTVETKNGFKRIKELS